MMTFKKVWASLRSWNSLYKSPMNVLRFSKCSSVFHWYKISSRFSGEQIVSSM